MAVKPKAVSAGDLIAIALISGSLLLLEVTLTRVFSVTMYYHFSFLAISLALLGAACSGIFVYAFPRLFSLADVRQQLACFGLAFAVSVVVCFLIWLRIPFNPQGVTIESLLGVAVSYAVMVIPFFWGGLCLAIVFVHWGSRAASLYFADLVGAGIGAMASAPALGWLGGPSTVLAAAVGAALAAVLFVRSGHSPELRRIALAGLVVAIGLVALNRATNVVSIVYVKEGIVEGPKLVERWNSFSRIAVFPERVPALTWGLSPRYAGTLPEGYRMNVDASAVTGILPFDGDLAPLDFLRYDVTNLVHYLRQNESILIVGSGGGRDVLSALLFGQRQVDAVEINPLIFDVVDSDLGEFSGRVYRQPGVRPVVAEARSYIESTDRPFGIIQASLVDTFAATAAGAFALAENYLYTHEAFLAYYRHLEADGILTMTRWYRPDYPGETVRLVSLAVAAWQAAGVANPADHLMVVAAPRHADEPSAATLLLKKTPFTPNEIDRVEQVADQLGFELVYTPHKQEGIIGDLARAKDLAAVWRASDLDLSPPTDDRPFFFYMIQAKDYARALASGSSADLGPNAAVVTILTGVLAAIALLVGLFVLGLLRTTRRTAPMATSSKVFAVAYFGCLGLAFMMIEVPLVQRFVLFLGHPTYALTVVIATLLVAAGAGSFLSGWVDESRLVGSARIVTLGLTGLLFLYVVGLPALFAGLIALAIPLKIAVSVAVLLPPGILMGMPFPIGLRFLARHAPPMVQWAWATNAVVSVFASILSVVVAINSGFSAALAVGILAYAAAFLVLPGVGKLSVAVKNPEGGNA